MFQQEKTRIEGLLGTKNNESSPSPSRSVHEERELYGRTIRIEEMMSLCAFCNEIENLISSLTLGDGENHKHGHDHDHGRDPLPPSPNKRAKVL